MDLRICVGVPSHGEWKASFGWALARLVAYFSECNYAAGTKQIDVVSISGSILPEVRHRIVAEAARMDATHLLWCDADMVFPVNALHRLLAHGRAIVGANYTRRTYPHMPTAHVDSDDYVGALYTDATSTGLVEVSHVGMGLLLTRMDVFDMIETPFFDFTPRGPENLSFQGEDVFFCQKLRAAGVKTWVDQDLSKDVRHIGEVQLSYAMAEKQREQFAKVAEGA